MTGLLLAMAAAAVVFLLLLWQVQSGGVLVRWDGLVNVGLKTLRRRPLLAAGAWISQIGTGAAGAIVCLVAAAALWTSGRPAWVGPIWLAFIGAQVTTWSLKFITRRRRPDFLEGITAASPSFPSAHATVSTVTYAPVALAIADGVGRGHDLILAVAAALILSISFSRILLSLHYLTDILAGAAVGLFWTLLAVAVAH